MSHRASEYRSKFDILSKCRHCHFVGHTAESIFVRWSNEVAEKQGVMFAKSSEITEVQRAGPSGQNNITFVRRDGSVDEDSTVEIFRRSADIGTFTQQ